MGVLVFIMSFIVFIISITVLSSKIQQNKSKKLLKELNNYSFEKIHIRFLQSSVGLTTITTGLPVKAVMYFAESLILITPKENGLFNGLFNINLPVIFIQNTEEGKNIKGIYSYMKPDKVSLSSWNAINIKYKTSLKKYSAQINLLDKSDIKRINKIKNWC